MQYTKRINQIPTYKGDINSCPDILTKGIIIFLKHDKDRIQRALAVDIQTMTSKPDDCCSYTTGKRCINTTYSLFLLTRAISPTIL
jgi:hypothetical protein